MYENLYKKERPCLSNVLIYCQNKSYNIVWTYGSVMWCGPTLLSNVWRSFFTIMRDHFLCNILQSALGLDTGLRELVWCNQAATILSFSQADQEGLVRTLSLATPQAAKVKTVWTCLPGHCPRHVSCVLRSAVSWSHHMCSTVSCSHQAHTFLLLLSTNVSFWESFSSLSGSDPNIWKMTFKTFNVQEIFHPCKCQDLANKIIR